MLRAVLGVIAVFIAWSFLDFLIHNVMLSEAYGATKELWRPKDEMKFGLISLVTFITSVSFVGIYYLLVQKKSLASGLLFGALFGLATGFSMGFGTYAVQPLPLSLAWSWLAGMLVETLVAGAITGLIVVPTSESPASEATLTSPTT